MLGLTQEALERQRNVNGSLSFNTPEYAAAIDMKNTADNSFNLRNLPVGGDFAQSVLNSATGVWGNIADYAGNPDGIGDYLNKYTTAQEMAMGEKPKADFSWDYFLNGLPRDTGNLVGSMAGLAVPAAVGAAAGPVGVIAGGLVGAGLESIAEGGGKLRESLENGDDLATAQNKARTVAGENAALLVPSNLLGLGIGKKMLSGIKNAYKSAGAIEGATGGGATQQALNAAKSKTAMDYLKGAGLAGAGAANESFQEVLQQGIQDSVDNKDWGILPQNWNEEQQEAFKSTIGPTALISALGGGVNAGARKLGYGQKPPTLEQENNQSYNNNLFGAGTADMSTQGTNIDEQVAGLKDGWQNVIPQIGGVIKNQFGIDGAQISSGFRTREHNAEVGGAEHSYHVGDGQHGDALDVVLPDSTTPEQAEAIRAEFENSGAFKEVLFHDSGSGYHLHLGGLNVDDMTNSGSYSGNADIDSMINEVANQYGIDPALLAAVADQESGFNQDANSGAGAIGIMQLMPDTAQGLGVDPNDLRGNIEGGAKYLRQMLDAYNGDEEKALAAYNAGPGSLDSVKGNISQLSAETQNYVPSVLEKYKKYKGRSARNAVGGNGSILNWDSVDDDYKAMDFFPKAGEESQGTANEFLENLAKLGESEKQEDVETAQKAMDALEQYSNDDAKLTKAAEELGYKQTVDPKDVHSRVPMKPIVKRALQNGEVTFATQKAADIFASTAVGQTMQRDGKTFKVTNDFSNNDIVKGIQQETGTAPYSTYTGTATVAANGQNGISVDSASANAIANGQSRTADNGGSSPLSNEDIGRLTSIMPSLPAQVQEQIQQAMANGDIETVRNILDGVTAERPLNTSTDDVNEAISTAQALSNIPEALADRDGMGAVKLNALQQMIRNGDVNGLNRVNKYMADNLRRQGIDPVAALNKKGRNLPAVQGERKPSTNVEETIPTVEGEVEDVITPEAPYTGNQIEAPAVESEHIGSDEFKERLNPVERGFIEYLDKVFENVQMGFDDVLDYLKKRQADIFNKRMETVIQQGVENFAKAFRASGGRILMNEMPSQEVQNAWQQLLAMRANFGVTLANAPTEIQNEYMRVEQVVKDCLNPIIAEQCQNNESWRKLNYAVTGLEKIAKKSRAYERSLQEEGKRSGPKGYRDVPAETREALENSAVAWADVLHKNGTTDSRIEEFLKTVGNSFTRNNHATTLRGKAQYNGKAMNKAGRIEALIQDGGRAEDRGGRYFAVDPNGNEIQVTRGEYNYYKWLKQNGFSQQKKAEPVKKDNTPRNDTPLLTEGNSRDSGRSDDKAGLEQGSAARQAETQGNKKATAENGEKTSTAPIPEKNGNGAPVNASDERDDSAIATTGTTPFSNRTGETNAPTTPSVAEKGMGKNENANNPHAEVKDISKTPGKDDEYYGYMGDKSDKEQANIEDLLSKPIKKDSTFGDVTRKERLELAYASGMYRVVKSGNGMYLRHATDSRNYNSKITKAEAEYYNYLDDNMSRAEVANKFTDEDIDRVTNNPDKARQTTQAKSIVGMIKKAGIKVVTDAAKIKEVLGDSLKNAYEDSRIQKLIISYKEGEKAPDLTLVKRTINGKDMWGVAFVGEKPKNYIPKKIGKAYKLMEMWPDGSLHALFAGTDKSYKIGEWNWAQGFTPDEAGGIKSMKLAPRYGWHMGTGVPATHHLMGVAGADGKGSTLNPKIGYPSKSGVGHPKGSKRVWVEVHYDATNDYSDIAEKNPGAEKDIRGLIPFGGYYMFQESNLSNWIIASSIKFDHVLSENERQDILSKAGYDEELMWRTYIVSKMLNKQMNPLKAAVATGWKCKNAGKASKAEKEKAKEIMSGPDAPPKYAGWIPLFKLSEKELEKSKKQLEKYQAVYNDNQRAIDAKTGGKDFGFKTLTAEEAAVERKRIREAVYDNPEWKADEEALQEGDGTQYFTTDEGEVLGFVKDGVVYLDPEHMNANTPIHEYTHVWDNVIRGVNPELWERGKELMKQSPVWDEIVKNPAYADIAQDEDLVASEVHARLTGEKGEILVDGLDSTGNGKGLAAKLKAWAEKYWQTLKDHFTKWGADKAGKVTLDEFVSMPLADLANGVNLAKVEKGKPQQKGSSDSSKNLPKQVEAVALKVFDSLTADGKEAYELAKEKLRTVGFNENTAGDKNYLNALATMLAFRAQVFANVMQTVYREKEYTARDYIDGLDLRSEKIRNSDVKGYHSQPYYRDEKEFLLNRAYIALNTKNSTQQSTSVLIHELGHAILKEMHNAVLNENCPEQLRKDFQIILEWISTTKKPRTSLLTEDRRYGGYKADPYINEEKFAQGLVNYFANTNRETVPREVASAFTRIAGVIVEFVRKYADWLNNAIRGGNKKDIAMAQKYSVPEIPDNIAEAIDRIFTGYGARPQAKKINPKSRAKDIVENGGQSSLFEDLTENPVNKHSADYLKENGNTNTELDRLPKVGRDKLRKSEQNLVKFGAAIGVNVHFVESSDKGNRGVFTHNGEIYINRKAAAPAKSIFVHEFVHWLKASPENAGAYDVLHACLENLDGIVSKERVEKYRKQIFDGENMTDEEIAEEIICDAMSNSEAAGKLMRAINNIDASLAAKVGSYLKAMWDKFCKAIGFQPNKLSREQTLPNELSVSEMQKADAALNRILMDLKNENGKPVFKRVGTELFLAENNSKPSEDYAINPIGYTYAAAYSRENESFSKQNSNNINGKSKYSRSSNAAISPSTNGVAIAQNANNNLLASMKGIVNRLNPLHHDELDNLRIDRKDDKADLSLIEYTFTSAARLAKKYKSVEPFFNIAKQAVTKQEQLRYYFNSKMNEIDETLGWSKLKNGPKFKERKEQLQKILFDGDVEGREYTNTELAQSGYEPEVIKAYRQMRALLDHAWKIANDTKSRIKYHSLACRSSAIADAEFADIQKKNPFAEVISKLKNADGTVTLNYKEPHIYHVAARNMTTAELNTLKQNKDVYIHSVKQGAVQGNVVVTYDQRNAGLNKRGGYVPHVFHGWYVCKVDKDGKPLLDTDGSVRTDSIMITADSMSEAVKLGEKLAKQNKNSKYVVTPQTFSAPGAQEQAVVMGDYDYAKVISKVANSMTMSLADARAMMDGTVKMKNRGRFYGYARQRKGFSGYEQNVYLATMKYFNQTARYVALDPFKRNAISMYNRTFGNFDDANVASRSATAKWIKKYISDMNGTPTFVEKMLNTFLHGLGVGRERAGGRPALWLQQNVFTYPMTIMKLGILNPASSILNLTQLFNLYGALGEKVMSGEAYRRLLENGFRDTFKAMSDKNSALGKLLWEDLGLNYQIGMDISAGYSNAEVTGLGSLHGFTARMAGKSMYFFRQSDAFARGVTLLTAYNKALSEGKSKAEAIEYAKVINDKVNFDYSVADEPWIFRAFGPISKVLLQFKKYPVKQIELFHDFYLEGRDAGLNKKQAAMRMLKYMAPYMAMSGVSGIPFISLAGGLFSALVATVSGDDDWDWEKKMKQYMIAEFGQDSPLTQWWLYGGGAMLGINVGSRIGVGDFMGSDSYNSADGVGGLLWNQTTLGSTVNQVSKQVSYRNYAEAVKAINPTVGNILQAYKGEVRTTRGRMKYEYQNLAERIWRGIGFTPLNEAMAGDLSSFEYAETQEQTKGKERAVDDFLADPSEENAKRLNAYGVTPKSIQTEAARRTMNRHELNQLEKEKAAKKAKSNKAEKKYSANDYLKKLNEK